ncbi:MAG: 3-deoxy-D-manno-octulosonic acid kinase [Steroidobacteraceae bacterium]
MNELAEPALRLLRTPLRGPSGHGAIFTNLAAGIEVRVPWFEPRYWIARGAIVNSHAGRGAVTVFEHESRRFVLRHYRRGGLPARFSADRYLWLGETRTRPLAEMQLTLRMHAAGLPVPVPVAVRYERQGMAYRADIITEYLPDTLTLAQRLAAGELGFAAWAAIGRCIRDFHDYGLCHADLNAHNILLRNDEEVFLVDFDRCARRRPGLWRDANLARLRRSLDALEDRRSEPRFDDAQWQCLLAAWL